MCLVQQNQVQDKPDLLIFTYIADDCFVPSPECVNANREHFLETKNKISSNNGTNNIVMQVMATLLDNVDTVLFTLTWNAEQQTLLVYPDFNDIASDPYGKEIDSDRRHFYHYSIENISDNQTGSYTDVVKELNKSVNILD